MDHPGLYLDRMRQAAPLVQNITNYVAMNVAANVLLAAGASPAMVSDAEEAEVRHDMLLEAMDSLNDREKHILTERRLTENPQTLEELSQVYDVSRERIRQIEVRAFEKLQKAMKTIAGEKLLPGVA